MTRALCAQLAGDTDEAEARAKEALRIGLDGGQPDATAFYGPQLGSLMDQRGTTGELVPLVEQLAAELPAITEAMTSARAAVYASAGRLEDAHQLLEEFAAADFELPPDPGSGLVPMICYADVCVACRDTTIAAALFDRLEPFADQVPTNFICAYDPVSYYLGDLAAVLGRYDQADTYFAQAAQFNRPRRRQILRRQHRPRLGQDARRTRCSGRPRTGSTPPHRRPRRRRGPRVRRHRTTSRRSTRTPRSELIAAGSRSWPSATAPTSATRQWS